ncbi:MAG: 2-nitropropane dioxygenase [Candidatus Cloacimonadota bacterium]|nr:MAG: 2-nitropropane dioxygenase [Candidatus Cloacimonadota bacterium]
MSITNLVSLSPTSTNILNSAKDLGEAISDLSQTLFVFKNKSDDSITVSTKAESSDNPNSTLEAIVSPIEYQNLGSKAFMKAHNLKYPYVAGAMANGIASSELIIAMGKAGMLGFFGAGGLHPRRVDQELKKIKAELRDISFGFNLLHNPHEPSIEEKTVEMYIEYGITKVSAAAYLGLNEYIVHYRLNGLKRDNNGNVVAKNHVFAKLSRSETARKFMAPAPKKIVDKLLTQGKITKEEAELSQFIPMAHDITAEADSGGHTDNRPLVSLLPTFVNLKNEAMKEYNYTEEIRIGAAGGISTPQSVLAAFAMGASYIVTGSVNQAAIEAGTSDYVKDLLAKMEPHDVAMAAAADMFEMGVKLQVLKKGCMFPMRANKLYSIYQSCESIETIPQKDKLQIEKQIFHNTLEKVWEDTAKFFEDRDPSQLVKAAKSPKHKMALIFRWYLGKSSLWAISGDESRKMDYQIWAGPSMGAFNEWTKGSNLALPKNRKAVIIAHNLLKGAAVLSRMNQLKVAGVEISEKDLSFAPDALMKVN